MFGNILFNPALNINDLVNVYDSVQNVKLRCKSHIVTWDGRDRIAVPMNLPAECVHVTKDEILTIIHTVGDASYVGTVRVELQMRVSHVISCREIDGKYGF